MLNKKLQEIDDRIVKRLQLFFGVEDPLEFRDDFICSMKRCYEQFPPRQELSSAQLEFIWMESVAELAFDEELLSLIYKRDMLLNSMYPATYIKIAS